MTATEEPRDPQSRLPGDARRNRCAADRPPRDRELIEPAHPFEARPAARINAVSGDKLLKLLGRIAVTVDSDREGYEIPAHGADPCILEIDEDHTVLIRHQRILAVDVPVHQADAPTTRDSDTS